MDCSLIAKSCISLIGTGLFLLPFGGYKSDVTYWIEGATTMLMAFSNRDLVR